MESIQDLLNTSGYQQLCTYQHLMSKYYPIWDNIFYLAGFTFHSISR